MNITYFKDMNRFALELQETPSIAGIVILTQDQMRELSFISANALMNKDLEELEAEHEHHEVREDMCSLCDVSGDYLHNS